MARFFADAVSRSGSPNCTGPCCGLSRRGFLCGLGAAGAALASPAILSAHATAQDKPAQDKPVQAKRRVIDVHHHYYPDAFKASSGRLPPFVKKWSPAMMLEEMDKNNIEQSILSLATVPLHWFKMPFAELRPLIRGINDYGAKLVQDHKGRHGLFAYVSGIDVEGSLKEIEYGLDTLKADGIEMSTSFGNKWPGDAPYDPVFAELNRRKATVYFHPIAPDCCGSLNKAVGPSWLEYPYDTGRTITNLLFTGALAKYRDINWIFSHSGGALPYLANRIEWQSRPVLRKKPELAPEGVMKEMQRLYYETANAASAPTMAALLKFVPPSQVMYGSDFPYVTSQYNLGNLRGQGFTDSDLKAMEYQNAEKMFPRLKKA